MRIYLILLYGLMTGIVGCNSSQIATVYDGKQEKKMAGKKMDYRERLIQRISLKGDINDLNVPRPLVTLEEFFEGNNDYGSIGYNFYPDQPSPAEFYQVFKTIREKPGVSDIRVEVKDLEDPNGWPATDTVWIITNASPEDIRQWLGERFKPDEVIEGFPEKPVIESYEIPHGFKALGVWWD